MFRKKCTAPSRGARRFSGRRWYRGAVKAVLTIVMLIMGFPALSSEPWRMVTVYDGLATLEVPAEWSEISPDLLDFFSIRAAETSGGRSAETYQFGFRPASTDVGFDLPQVLIQVREGGRIPYGQFARLPSLSDVEASTGGFSGEDHGPFVRGVHLDRLAFDADRKVLLMDSTLDLSIEGLTGVRTASFLTERGLFIVHCYDRLTAMESSADVFDRIIQSVTFSDDLRYRPRWSDHWSSRYGAAVLFALAAAAAVFALIQWRRARREVEEAGAPPRGS